MKKTLLIFLIAAIAGFSSFFLMRMHHRMTGSAVLLDKTPELTWLRKELSLSDEQFSKAQALHIAYRPRCEEMCRNICEARDRMKCLAAQNHTLTPELDRAIENYSRVRSECLRNMLTHLYQTAALMDEKQARRYLDTVLPHVLDPDGESESGHNH